MRLETCCNRQIDCMVCPQKSEGVLVYRHYPKGQHFSAEKCTQNSMIFMLKGELLVNSDEYPGTTLQSRQLILQAIGSKVELLALTEVGIYCVLVHRASSDLRRALQGDTETLGSPLDLYPAYRDFHARRAPEKPCLLPQRATLCVQQIH